MKRETKTTSTAFCKLFETEQYGQVLFIREYDADNDKPIIKMMAWATNMNGMGTITANYDDDDKADEAFSKIDEEMAIEVGRSFNDIGSEP